MSFDKWSRALAGEKVVHHPQPDETDEGYYRIPIKEPVKNAQGQNNGQKKTVGWIPVAYYLWNGTLEGSIGVGGEQRDMTANEVIDKWTHCCRYPIKHEEYVAVAMEGLPWSDMPLKSVGVNTPMVVPDETTITSKIIDDVIPERGIGDNKPPEALAPEVEHATAIDTAIGAALTKVSSEADAALAAGSKNRIAELRLAADKAGKAVYQPLHAAYVTEREKWLPIVNRANVAEGKIQTAILTFRESERKRLAKEKADADTRQQEIDAANQRAADRAIAAGKPEPAPVVAEVAPLVQPAPIQPTYGKRSVKEEVKKFAVIEDGAKVYDFFKGNADIQALLLKLATTAIRAGTEVPGTTTREGLI